MVVMGAGAYVCGEETALIESLEGFRGEPRNRPPFPVVSGFLNRPSVVNNVETLAWVPCILAKGVDWFKSIGTDDFRRPQAVQRVRRLRTAGRLRVPLRHHRRANCCGRWAARSAKAVQIGGASGRCVPAKEFERRLAFEDIPTGGSIIVIGPGRDMLDLAHNLLDFFVDESCGQCTPCRLGNSKLLEGGGDAPRGHVHPGVPGTSSKGSPTPCRWPPSADWARPARWPSCPSSSISKTRSMPECRQVHSPNRRAPLSQLFQPDLEPEPPSPDAIGATVSVTIDGIETKVPLGTTILEAAKSIGVRIPTLCYHPDLEVAGICRICVVEVEGQRTLQAACAYPITAPIKINTYSKAVRIARRHVLDLLLSEHCGDCYSCKRNGNCELQALAEEYGVDKFRFGHLEIPVPVDDSSYSVVRDMNKCIRCRRCVRTCIDMQEVGVLEAINRSNKVEISTFLHKPLVDVVCINCGQCINRCPTAALYAKTALRRRCGRPSTIPPSTWSSRRLLRRGRPWVRCSAWSRAPRSPTR